MLSRKDFFSCLSYSFRALLRSACTQRKSAATPEPETKESEPFKLTAQDRERLEALQEERVHSVRKHHSQSAEDYFERAQAFIDCGEDFLALDDFKTAIKQDPNFADA